MHKLWHWFRGDNDPKFWHGAAASGDKRRWRSERAVGGRARAGAKRQGAEVAQDFGTVHAASVSSPTVLLPSSKSVKTVQDRLVVINGNKKRPSKSSVGSTTPTTTVGDCHAATSTAPGTTTATRPACQRRQNTQSSMAPSTSSPTNQKGSRSQKSRDIAATTSAVTTLTTDDLPDKMYRNTANGAEFHVDKKSVSANEMVTRKKQQRASGLLQRIKQRFSNKHGNNRQSAMVEPDNAVPTDRRISVTMTVAVETCQNGGGGGNEQQQKQQQSKQQLHKQQIAQQRREDYGLGGDCARSGDAIGGEDDVSQGRCSSFDYFSATASPIEQQQPVIGEPAQLASHSASKTDNEEELRFATAAEARAYLRRQHGIADQHEEEEEEQEGCDADDEITTATTSAMCNSLLVQKRPHSAMASTPGQRESVYFTATVLVQSATTPDIARRKGPLQQQQQKVASGGSDQSRECTFRGLPRQKSRSQIALADSGAGDCGSIGTTAGNGHGSVPGSTTLTRRQLRFIIPQVSICDAECIPRVAHKSNNNDNEEEEEDEQLDNGEEVDDEQLADEMNPDDFVNNNSHNKRQEARDGATLTEQDKQLRKALSQMDRRELTLAQRRQSNMDVVHQASGRRTSTTLIPLTSAQIHLIRSLWRQVYLSKGPTVIGSQISHRLFFKEPEMREMFRRCALPQQFANHDSFSKAHCKQISELIDQVVESLDDLEHVGPLLEQVGRCHAHISGGQLSSKLWNAVAETFIDCTLEWGDRRARSETVRKAWALIIAFMVERIKHGHLEERRHISALRSTIASLERVAMASTTVQQPYYDVQQPTTSSSTQLPVPVSSFCHPIRRVSAFATTGSFSPSADGTVAGQQTDHFRTGGGTSPMVVGTMPKYSVEVASSEPCSLATFANTSPYANQRRHAQPAPSSRTTAEKGREKKQQHRRSSSSSDHQSPKLGSLGTVRRREGGALSQRTSRTESARKTTTATSVTNSAIPLSLGSVRKRMSTINSASTPKQNAKSSAGGPRSQWADI